MSKESSCFLLDDVRYVVPQFEDGPKAVMTSFEDRVDEGVGGFVTGVSSKTITSGDDDDESTFLLCS